jgi:hypothetical protein
LIIFVQLFLRNELSPQQAAGYHVGFSSFADNIEIVKYDSSLLQAAGNSNLNGRGLKVFMPRLCLNCARQKLKKFNKNKQNQKRKKCSQNSMD